jgi:hypothetical protein
MASVVLIVVAATGMARAAAPMHPYKLQPARRCLIRHHARLALTKHTRHPDEIQWILGREGGALPPANWIPMTFSLTPRSLRPLSSSESAASAAPVLSRHGYGATSLGAATS